MLVTSPHPPSPGCKIQEIGKFATKHFRFCRGYNFGISNQRDEKTWPDQQKDKDKDNNNNNNDKDNLRYLWPLRHCIQFGQLRIWIHDNHCDLTIKSNTGQNSQMFTEAQWCWFNSLLTFSETTTSGWRGLLSACLRFTQSTFAILHLIELHCNSLGANCIHSFRICHVLHLNALSLVWAHHTSRI